MNNIMDNMTAKEREEAMGLTESQKMSLEATGLTKKEINEIHAKRVAENIAKERERLEKLEEKIVKKVEKLPDYLAKLLNGGDGQDEDEADNDSVDEKNLPWYGRDDLIMTDEEFWNEVNKVAPPSDEELDLEDKIFGDFQFDDNDMALYNELHSKRINSKPTEEIYERRRLGALKAEYEWYKSGCIGKRPKGVSDILLCSTMFGSDRGIKELSYKWLREKYPAK